MDFNIKVENANGNLNKNFTITGAHFPMSAAGYKEFDLVFDKFFPYDNGNGQPIYNSADGSVLRDPVTGL
jgi:hypothetical protein